MTAIRNAPELWRHTQPAVQETEPADLDGPLMGCPPCTGDCRQGRACPSRTAYYGARGAYQAAEDRLAELDAIDRSAQAWERWIVRGFVVLLACFGVAHYWPDLARWLP